jgi:hypothetical protein
MAKCKPCKTAIFTRYRKERGYDHRRYWKNPAGERERHLIRKYGVTLADYERMFAAQDGRCGVCGKTQERAFDVDHDHSSGEVRGLLCTSCNRMIGHGGDSPETLEAAAAYLRSFRSSRRRSSARYAPGGADE